MKAVNLIPTDRRQGGKSVSASPAFIGLLAGLAVVLVAAVLFVSLDNKVSARKAELAQVTAGVARWQTAADSYSRYVTAAKARATKVGDVVALAKLRFAWPHLLDQLAEDMPAQAALTSIQATTPSASAAAGSGESGVQLQGCAATHAIVAQTMVQLHRIDGVSGVTLAQATKNDTGSGGGDSSGSSSCPFPVTFQITLNFPTPAATPSATDPSAPTSSAAPSSSPSTPSAGVAQ